MSEFGCGILLILGGLCLLVVIMLGVTGQIGAIP